MFINEIPFYSVSYFPWARRFGKPPSINRKLPLTSIPHPPPCSLCQWTWHICKIRCEAEDQSRSCYITAPDTIFHPTQKQQQGCQRIDKSNSSCIAGKVLTSGSPADHPATQTPQQRALYHSLSSPRALFSPTCPRPHTSARLYWGWWSGLSCLYSGACTIVFS